MKDDMGKKVKIRKETVEGRGKKRQE